jgi:predicted phosphoribosyltransferase
MTKTQKETEDAILKLINTLTEYAKADNCTGLALGFQALTVFIKTNAHFNESYIEQLKIPFQIESSQKVTN